MKFELDNFQKQAIKSLLDGLNVLVTAPTGSGKTLIAEKGIEKYIEDGKKVIYTTPIKALSNQKFNEFTEKYSSIVRMPNNVYSNKENTIIKQISTKYLNNEKGRHLRIFDKNTDAYIIGYLLNISKRNNLKIKKIKGHYLIENNKFYLDKIVINNKPISNRILLSQFNKRCYDLV